MYLDRPLARIYANDIELYQAERIEEDGKYFPLEMQEEVSGETFRRFCEERLTPPTRIHLDRELRAAGFDRYSFAAVLIASDGRDCSDPYWVRFDTGPQTWKEVWEAIGVYNKT